MVREWKALRSETIAKGYDKEFRKTIFINPVTGQEEAFFSYGGSDWTAVLALTPEKEVISVLEYKQGCQKIVRELPGGGINAQERPVEAVKREFLEETGYQCQKLIPLGPPMWTETRNCYTRFYLFLGLDCKKVKEKENAPSEQIETELVPLEKWLEMAHHELENSAAIIATFRALPHLG